MANVALGVGALSYAGQFNIAVIADRDAHPDLDVFADGLRAEFAALGATVSPSEPTHDQRMIDHSLASTHVVVTRMDR